MDFFSKKAFILFMSQLFVVLCVVLYFKPKNQSDCSGICIKLVRGRVGQWATSLYFDLKGLPFVVEFGRVYTVALNAHKLD